MPIPLPIPALKIEDLLTVIEIDEGVPFFMSDLIRRRFNADTPDEPRSFIAFYKAGPHEYWPVGYVKQTPYEDCYLCGTLVVDNLLIKKMPAEHRTFIYDQHGGVAEQVLRESLRRIMPSAKAIWGLIGDPRALAVDTRVGFRPTGVDHLYVIWNDDLVKEHEKAELLEKVIAFGEF